VISVIVVLGILASIAGPDVGYHVNKAEADVCDVNRSEIGRLYHECLVLDGVDHSDVLFVEFLGGFDNTCPVGRGYGIMDGEVFVICMGSRSLRKRIRMMLGCRFCRVV